MGCGGARVEPDEMELVLHVILCDHLVLVVRFVRAALVYRRYILRYVVYM